MTSQARRIPGDRARIGFVVCGLVIMLLKLAAGVPVAQALSAPSSGNGIVEFTWGTSASQTFNYTGSAQTFTVPPGVTSVTVAAIGAAGGSSGSVPGGAGADVTDTIHVSPAQTLYVVVGGVGQAAQLVCGASGTVQSAGGFNGGGLGGWVLGGIEASAGAGGGGASDVQTSSSVPNTTSWLAGAGGGGGAGGPGEANCASDSVGGAGGAAGANGSTGVGSASGPGGTCGPWGGQAGYAGENPPETGDYSSGGAGGCGDHAGLSGGNAGCCGDDIGGTGGTATEDYGIGDPPYYAGGGGGGGGGGYDGGGGGGSGGSTSPANSGQSYPAGDGGGGGGGGGASYTPAEPQPQLVVNSTATGVDSTDAQSGVCNITPSASSPTCTLPQAMAVSNDIGGATIDFDIPQGPDTGNTFDGGVPQIEEGSGAVLELTAPTVIDGGSQPDGGQVELSGVVEAPPAVSQGLVLGAGAGGSTIEGMVINGFQEMIDLQGPGNTVEGDWLGTDPAGTAADPTPLGPPNLGVPAPLAQVAIRVQSSGNQLGGPSAGQGNVIASGYTLNMNQLPVLGYGLFGAGEIDDTVGGNFIQGNRIGVSAVDGVPLITATPPVASGVVVEGALSLSGAADTVGGSADGDGNLIAGGGTITSVGSVLQGNTITDGGLDVPAAAKILGVDPLSVSGAVTVGGATTTPGQVDGNVFSAVAPTANPQLTIEGSGTVVQGNAFHDDAYGAIQDSGTNVTIGGQSAYGLENLFEDDGTTLTDTGTDGAVETVRLLAAITTESPGNSHTRIEHNDFEDNQGGGAVDVDGGDGITITDNVMRSNAYGTLLGDHYYYDGEKTPDDDGPNNYLEFPNLYSADKRDGATEITGDVTESATFAGTGFTVDLYAQASCAQDSVTPGQGAAYLGSRSLRSLLGNESISMSFDAPPAGDGAVSATLTGPDGSTSEFSPCLTLGHKAPRFAVHGVTSATQTVPVGPAQNVNKQSLLIAPRESRILAPDMLSQARTQTQNKTAEAKKGYGTLSLFCPPVTTRYCKGTFALKTRAKHPRLIARGKFKLAPGEVKGFDLTTTGKPLAALEHARRLHALLATTARDGAKHPHHKNTSTRITLTYA